MKNLYDYNDSDNELDGIFIVMALLIGAAIGAGVTLILILN